MSWLSQGIHAIAGGGQTGNPGLFSQLHNGGGGLLDTLGGVLMSPFYQIRNEVANLRAQPEILQMRLADMRARAGALERIRALEAARNGGALPQDPNLPQGVSVMQGNENLGMGIPDAETIAQAPPQGVAQPAGSAPMTGTDFYRQAAPLLADLAAHGGRQTAATMGTIYNNAQTTVGVNNDLPYDTGTGRVVGGPIGVNNTNVNGWMVNAHDPRVTGNYYGPAPAPGAIPTRDANGNPTGWETAPGAANAIATASGAETQGRTAYSPQTVNDGGRSRQGLGIDIFGGHQTYTGQTPGDTTYNNHTADTAAAQYQAITTAGQTALQRIPQLQQLRTLLDGYNGNRLSPTGIDLARVGASVGLPVDPNLRNQEAALAITRSIALSLRSNMPGPLSNGDREYLNGMTPGLEMTAQGRNTLISAQLSVAQREAETARFARQWQQRYGRIDALDSQGRSFNDQMQRYAETHPLFGTRR